MESNYPAGAEFDRNAPWNEVDYPPRPHEVELHITFTLNAKGMDYATDDVSTISKKVEEFIEKMKGVNVEDVVSEIAQLNAGYDEEQDEYDYDEDYAMSEYIESILDR